MSFKKHKIDGEFKLKKQRYLGSIFFTITLKCGTTLVIGKFRRGEILDLGGLYVYTPNIGSSSHYSCLTTYVGLSKDLKHRTIDDHESLDELIHTSPKLWGEVGDADSIIEIMNDFLEHKPSCSLEVFCEYIDTNAKDDVTLIRHIDGEYYLYSEEESTEV